MGNVPSVPGFLICPFVFLKELALRLAKRRVAMLPTQLLSVLHESRCVCVRGSCPAKNVKDDGTPLCW